MKLQDFQSEYDAFVSSTSFLNKTCNETTVQYNTEQFFNTVENPGLSLICSPRQIGLSTRMATYLALNMDKNVILVSPKLDQSEHLLNLVKSYYSFKGDSKILPNSKYNYGRISVISNDKTKLYGLKPDIMVIDSASYCRNFLDLISVVAPILNPGGKIIAISSPNENSQFNMMYNTSVNKTQLKSHFSEGNRRFMLNNVYSGNLKRYQEEVLAHIF